MTIDAEFRNKLRRMYFVDYQTINAIAKMEGVHYDTVKRALSEQISKTEKRHGYSRLVASFDDLIKEKLEQYPKMKSTRLIQILEDRGYRGSLATLQRHLRALNPKRPKRVYLPMKVSPGEQGQVDWAHFGSIKIGNANRKLYLFVFVLSWSRYFFGRFSLSMDTSNFLDLHENAFQFFQGVPRIILYDNLKSAVIDRRGSNIRFNEQMLDFSGFYNFEPRACNPYSGNEKGRAERKIRYVRDNFFCGREFDDLQDLNSQFSKWLSSKANLRPLPSDTSKSIKIAFAEEQEKLLRLPKNRFQAQALTTTKSGKFPYVRFDLNNYSIPPLYLGHPLTIRSSHEQIEIFYLDESVAKHQRCWDKGQYISDKTHIEAIKKTQTKRAYSMEKHLLIAQFKEVSSFLDKNFELKADPRSTIFNLTSACELYGNEIFQEALTRAMEEKKYTHQAINHYCHLIEKERKSSPKASLALPKRADVRNLEVTSHDPSVYDSLGDKK